ncbi:MAG: hypothetical protein ACYS9X_28755, partial [Planctomycetota bacterium]
MFQTEPVVSRFKRISPHLAVRSDGDEVRITTRATGLRVIYTLVFSGVALLLWYLVRERVFANAEPLSVAIFAGAILAPLAILGVVRVFPGQRLIASRSGGFVAVQRRWLCFTIAARRVELEQCHRVSIFDLRKQTETEGDVWVPGTIVGLASFVLLGLESTSRRTNTVLVPVHAIEVVRRDGTSTLSHFTSSGEDCDRAMAALWEVFPEFAPKPLEDEVRDGLAPGARVRISLDWGWARGARGAVKEAPPTIAKCDGGWEGHLRRLDPPAPAVSYWVEFDE